MVRASLVALTCVASSVSAQEPACFVGRTVFGMPMLVDAHGRSFGVLAPGEVVRVVEDHVGPDRELAEVRVVSEHAIRGRMRREDLFVFARTDIPIVEGWSWLRRGAPLQMIGGSSQSARVRYGGVIGDGGEHEPLDPGHDQLSRWAQTAVACRELEPRSRRDVGLDGEDCCELPDPVASPQRQNVMLMQAVTLLSEDERHHAQIEPQPVRVLRETDRRSLVEVDLPRSAVRLRGWVDSSLLTRELRHIGIGSMCSPEFGLPIGGEAVALLADTELHAAAGGDVIARLKKGTRLRSVDKQAGFYRVVLREPDDDAWRLWLAGWVPENALPPRSRDQVVAHLDGRVMLAAGARAQSLAGLRVEIGDPQRRTVETDEQGRFRFDFDDALELSFVQVKSADGLLTGNAFDVAVAHGGTKLAIAVGHAAVLRGTVATASGVRLPQTDVVVFKHGAELERPELATDAQGRFEVTLPAGTYRLAAYAGDELDWQYVLIDVPASEPQIIAPRRRVWLGAVERRADGSCAHERVQIDAADEEEVVVGSACTFSVELPSYFRHPDDELFALRAVSPDGALVAEVEQLQAADPASVCLGRTCPAPASLWVNVADALGVAVQDARVHVTATGKAGVRLGCTASKGTCFVHGLLSGVKVKVSARAPDGRKGFALLTTAQGVTDVVVRLAPPK